MPKETAFYGKVNEVAERHKDAFLGKSKGKLNAFGMRKIKAELDEVLEERQKGKMKPAKVLISS